MVERIFGAYARHYVQDGTQGQLCSGKLPRQCKAQEYRAHVFVHSCDLDKVESNCGLAANHSRILVLLGPDALVSSVLKFHSICSINLHGITGLLVTRVPIP